ncbi:hypothetical protein SAMN05216499_103305 [Actinacidiphila paucisporea]|uniref:Uncharacterized protein n=1 Tax=Actinacidiphila paucisporea TaxID=310782 RepID=A0A1M6ZEY1_9ACTN|nr:hypothetical protein SAMN05216499_103305 [Actinacidiphila paucisporea]
MASVKWETMSRDIGIRTMETHVMTSPASSGEGRRTQPLPRTIEAISAALSEEKRQVFHAALWQAPLGPELDDVMNVWWMEAMFDAVPGRERRLTRTVAGRDLVRLPDLLVGDHR